MRSCITSAALLCLLAGAMAAVHTPHSVFLDKQQASSLISRQKRNIDGSNPSSLEQVCMEKVCNYEEARKIFQDSYRTDIFWAVYIDGDQCAENPCKNGAMCSDSVGGYDCVCKSGFSGVHCEKDQTLCILEKNKGCSQFCKPGYTSYECSCARGWKLNPTVRDQCVPAVTFPCGKVNSLRQWEDRLSKNVRSSFEGLSCSSTDCPWQALLKSPESAGFCSGVILKENLVLTSAQCAKKYVSFEVAVGKRNTNTEDGEQIMYVKLVHIHPRFVEGRPENDLAVIELRDRIRFKKEVTAVCLPEKYFAESVLMMGELPAMVTGWKEPTQGSAFQGPLTLNQLAYERLPQCLETHPNLVTNKMGCTTARTNADCTMSSGSPLLTLYREVFFLTGVVSQPPGADCSKGYIFQKVSRHLGWLQPFMSSPDVSSVIVFRLKYTAVFFVTYPRVVWQHFPTDTRPPQSSHSLPRRWLLSPKNGSAPLLGRPVEIHLSGAPSFLSLVLLSVPASSIYMLKLAYTQRHTLTHTEQGSS